MLRDTWFQWRLQARRAALVCIGFGDAPASLLGEAGPDEADSPARVRGIHRPHPAAAEELFALENPFSLRNHHLDSMGAGPVDW